jgi:hypothetical protein|tara:strand:- start:302 stop:430 length:129 start_codon:yes stop_codon:yes gene_type:complete
VSPQQVAVPQQVALRQVVPLEQRLPQVPVAQRRFSVHHPLVC